MKIVNQHERAVAAPMDQVVALVKTLGTSEDKVWPHELWMTIKFEVPLAVGVNGGHGPIKYTSDVYEPDKQIRFVFTQPKGFDGYHEFLIRPIDSQQTIVMHKLRAIVTLPALCLWSVVIRPLHDALVEDAFDKLEKSLSLEPAEREWGSWVKFLRKKRGYT